jgi:hypothetical protein
MVAREGQALGRRPAGRGVVGRTGGRGQVLVIFALSITVLFAAAGLAFDIGRFYSERRFLQNAADAAALAAASALTRGETNAQAEIRARESLTTNFSHSPSGITPSLPPATPEYASGHAGQPEYLVNGILIAGGEIRVAVQNSVGYTFGRIVGLDQNQIGGQARVLTTGNMLPIAVRRYVNLPGPIPGTPPVTCVPDETQFMDFFATSDTACLGSETNATLRTEPAAGNPFNAATPDDDPASHGPLVAIVGQGAQPSNGADFRGFIALDIRNFYGVGSQLYYNGVTSGTSSTALKDMEANWILARGYPGPQFPAATTPPDFNDQVATMSGNDTGLVIDNMLKRYNPGDEIMVAIYPGNVMAIPDFSLSAPATIALPAPSGVVVNAGSLKASCNQQFAGSQVDLTTLADTGDPDNPMVTGTLLGGANPITYTPNPVTPTLGSGTVVNLTNMTTLGATPGVYTLWVQGQAGAPYLTTKLEPFAINVGGVTRDFTITAGASTAIAAVVGDTVTFDLNLKRSGIAYNVPVNLSLDGPLPTGMGATSFSSASVTPGNGGSGVNTTLTINTGTMIPGRHRIVVRATGMNADATPRKVTHLLQLWVDVETGGSGNQEYVDIVGFAVMRIATMDTNTVSAYAITPVIADPSDYRLRRGQAVRLVPWN